MNAAAQPHAARHVLVVDDDADLRQHISQYLAEHGFVVHTAADGPAMARELAARPIDLVVLDVMMPGENGLSICRRLADEGGPPVIMLSAAGEEIDRVLGLELGADDYLPKPCSPRELLARVRAVIRRRQDSQSANGKKGRAYHFLGFTFDTVRRQLRAPNGVGILLTAGEFSLLSAFLEHPQQVLSRDRLLDLARGGDADVFDRAVDVQISRLRRKLHACCDEEIIRTHRGSGYLFDAKVIRV